MTCRHFRLSALILALFLLLLNSPSFSIETEKYFNPKTGKYAEVAAGEVLVKYRSAGYSAFSSKIQKKHGIKIKSSLLRGFNRFKTEKGSSKTVDALIKELKNDPDVEYAEPNYIVKAFSLVPNDTNYSYQWGPKNISCEAVWGEEKGSSSVIIAVIDTGVLLTHDDLINKVAAGYDFVDDDADPTDLNGHGTHVSGIAAAQTNNSVGIVGISWNSKIMPVRVLNAAGVGTDADVISGIEYAADNGAKILNLSLGSDTASEAVNVAVQYAYSKGCVIVAAAGNSGDSTWSYPASYENVLSIAAVDRNNGRASYSSYNSHVDLSAPGGEDGADPANDIYSCYLANGYAYMSGTSMAAAHVSGLVALIMSQHPEWTNAQVEVKLISSVDDPGAAGRDNYYGYGEINAYKALNTVPSVPAGLSISALAGNISLSWTANSESDLAGYKIYRSTSSDGTYSRIGLAASTEVAYSDAPAEGTYYYKISSYDLAGLESDKTAAKLAILDSLAPVVPTINPVVSPTNLARITITGTKSADSSLILANGSSSGVNILSSTEWEYPADLTSGSNMFTFKAKDAGENVSSPATIEVIQKPLSYSDGDSGAVIELPVGSSREIVLITIESYSNPEALGRFPVARVILGTAINFISNVSVFSTPITITMDIPAGSIDPQPYFWDEALGCWSNSGLSIVSVSSSTITFTTTHLSIYAIFGSPGIISSILIYPNPFNLASCPGVNFNGLSGSEKIRIFTIAGEAVRSYDAQGRTLMTWDGKNESGGLVSRGIYIYIITNNLGQKKTGKIAVLNK